MQYQYVPEPFDGPFDYDYQNHFLGKGDLLLLLLLLLLILLL
jgi:hypothetical protein